MEKNQILVVARSDRHRGIFFPKTNLGKQNNINETSRNTDTVKENKIEQDMS